MANEAYRAVFLRVHPTGKMVLSPTTGADGEEAGCARLVADGLGVPALDVKVVPADTDRFGTGHGYNTVPSAQTPAAIQSATGKIRAKSQAARGCRARDLARQPDLGQRCVRQHH
jgi:CO/xanthine dehydrogenase Mo-binding subunit